MFSEYDIHETFRYLGYDLVADFLNMFEGKCLNVPNTPKQIMEIYPQICRLPHPDQKKIGLDGNVTIEKDNSIEKITDFYGGREIHVPFLLRKELSSRDQEVVEAKEKGKSIQDIAIIFNLTNKRIYQILSNAKQNARRPQKRFTKRNKDIVVLYKNGETIKNLAKRSMLSERRVIDILLDANCVCIKPKTNKRIQKIT